MRILFLPAYYYPEHAASSYLGDDLRQSLCDDGNEILLYAPTPCRGVSDEVRKEYSSLEHRQESLLNGRLIVNRFRLPREKRNPISRFLRYVLCWIKQYNRGCSSEGIDCIFLASTPPIQGLLGAFLKRRKHIPFVYNLQDIFPDSLSGSGLAKKGGLLWKIGRIVENYTYRHADRIIVISEDFKRNIMAKGVPEEKIEVIYNWVDAKLIKPVDKSENPLFDEFGIKKDIFTVVYAGNLGNAQNINILLDAAFLLPTIQFVLFGTGGIEEEIKMRIKNESILNVRLFPIQPYERVSQVYSLGDVCVVSCKAGFGGSAMPSKTWSIMSCGRPVLASFDEGELQQILEKNSCGVFTHAGNIDEFVWAIRGFADEPKKCIEMGVNARCFIEENLTKEVGTKKYVDVIKSINK